jgi:crotonobetainyl-CoA:carnitine CoA-transferase CaiB-like acyl-CoA transferase
MPTVLRGIRVIEQGTFITGPACAMLLGDLGADVIKLEQAGSGDPFRSFNGGLYSPHFQTYNRNKRSVEVDLKSPEDRMLVERMIRESDVYIQNFRPGVADKLGMGEQRLRELNPRLIYCSISGFGRDGPAADRPSYDTVAQAASGYLNLLVNPANPRVVGPAIADAVTGFYAAYGILGALVERASTGAGRAVEVSMLEAMCHFNLDAFTHFYSVGEVMGPYSRPSVSQSYILECKDGKRIALHMSSPEKFWEGLADAIGQPQLLQEPRFATRGGRIQHQEDLIEVLGQAFLTRTRREWCDRLEERDVPYAPVYDTSEALEDPQARHLRILVSARHPEHGEFRTVRSPVSYDGMPDLHVLPPPSLGQHTREVREQFAIRPATPGYGA